MKFNIMKKAHQITKRILKLDILDKSQDYFSLFRFVLTEAWSEAKFEGTTNFDYLGVHSVIEGATEVDLDEDDYDNKEVQGINSWVINHNLSDDDRNSIIFFSDKHSIIRETKKAVEVKFLTDVKNITMWAPKSQLTENFY